MMFFSRIAWYLEIRNRVLHFLYFSRKYWSEFKRQITTYLWIFCTLLVWKLEAKYHILYHWNTEVFLAWSNHPKNHFVTNDDESWWREFDHTFKKTRLGTHFVSLGKKNKCVSTDESQKLTPLLLCLNARTCAPIKNTYYLQDRR